MVKLLLRLLFVAGFVRAFTPPLPVFHEKYHGKRIFNADYLLRRIDLAIQLSTSSHDAVVASDPVVAATNEVPPAVTVQETVKLFGKLAEKYIMLDATGGMCCYSACSDCEYREPGGGYRMADQSSSRPKWIPTYEYRKINDKEHTSKWSLVIYDNSEANAVVVSKEQFLQAVSSKLEYAPILGGPSLAASAAAAIDDTRAAEYLFDILSEGKEVLTKHRMTVRLKQLAGGDQGLVWAQFQQAMGLSK